MTRTAPRHSFAGRCPNGHRPAQSHTLRELRHPSLQFYCAICEAAWQPEADERARAVGFAEAAEDWNFTPPSAA
jgi:hypothetical protein